MAEDYCCTSSAQAAQHMQRAWLLLNAAAETYDLSGAVYRHTLSLAMRALGQAAIALQNSEVAHAG